MLKIKVFMSAKSGKKVVALIAETPLREHMLSFDIGVLCDVADMTPSQLASLECGVYQIKRKE